MFGLSAIPLVVVVGSAVDYVSSSRLQVKVASATDAAILAISSSVMEDVDLTDSSAVKARFDGKFEEFFLKNFSSSADPSFHYNSHTIAYDGATGKVSVDVDVDYDTSFMKIIGQDTVDLSVHAAAKLQSEETKGALSLYMVLDRSGSMGWNYPTRMTSLKIAVNDMVTNLKAADPDNKYVRMGAVAYNHYTWTQQKIVWNLNKSNNYVQAMAADGGTDSSGGVLKAYKQLKKPKEINKHAAKNGQVPKLVMVFMTDGDNNASSSDTATIATCNDAKNYGIEIFTVAFQAPSSGQQLLSDCASDASHYFEPESTAELIAAFNKIGSSVSASAFLSE